MLKLEEDNTTNLGVFRRGLGIPQTNSSNIGKLLAVGGSFKRNKSLIRTGTPKSVARREVSNPGSLLDFEMISNNDESSIKGDSILDEDVQK